MLSSKDSVPSGWCRTTYRFTLAWPGNKILGGEILVTREDRSNVAQLASVLLEEYKGLRQEIATRSTSQATILSLNVTAIGAIASVFFAGHIKDVRLFFIIPVISSIL